MCVGLDPSGRGADCANETKRLCFTCNDDQTAKNVRKWFEGLEIAPHEWYATNLVMHGISGRNQARGTLFEKAVSCCSGVLAEQLEIVKPMLVIAFGKRVAEALYDHVRHFGNAHPSICWRTLRDLPKPLSWGRGRWIAPLPHPGYWGTKNSGGPPEQEKRWRRIGRWLQARRNSRP